MRYNTIMKKLHDVVINPLRINSLADILHLLEKNNGATARMMSDDLQLLHVAKTLRRLEITTFLADKIDEAVELKDFLLAHELDQIHDFYQLDEYPCYFDGRRNGFSLWKPDFFRLQFMFIYHLLGQFETTQILDTEDNILINYEHQDIPRLQAIIQLVKENEILYGWNKMQVLQKDYVSLLEKGSRVQIIKTGPEMVVANIRDKAGFSSEPGACIIVVLCGASFREEEMRELHDQLTDLKYEAITIRLAMKETKELEATVNILYEKNSNE